MSIPILLDIVIIAILLCFVAGGIRLGFIRALCSLLAVFVAFFGAFFLAKYLTPVAVQIATPYALPSIVEKLEGEEAAPSRDFSEQETKTLLQNLGLPDSWSRIIEKNYSAQETDTPAFTSPSQMLANYILKIIITGALFLLSFIILLILWAILSRTLDLVAKLPVLNFCNRTLGAVIGLLKGLVLLLVLRWVLCDLTEVISPELVENTLVFQWLSLLLSYSKLNRFLL